MGPRRNWIQEKKREMFFALYHHAFSFALPFSLTKVKSGPWVKVEFDPRKEKLMILYHALVSLCFFDGIVEVVFELPCFVWLNWLCWLNCVQVGLSECMSSFGCVWVAFECVFRVGFVCKNLLWVCVWVCFELSLCVWTVQVGLKLNWVCLSPWAMRVLNRCPSSLLASFVLAFLFMPPPLMKKNKVLLLSIWRGLYSFCLLDLWFFPSACMLCMAFLCSKKKRDRMDEFFDHVAPSGLCACTLPHEKLHKGCCECVGAWCVGVCVCVCDVFCLVFLPLGLFVVVFLFFTTHWRG